MGYVFLAIVMAFSLTAAIYLWANDFNRETYPIIFPAIGAIALSVYLGIKIIWIDEHDPNQSKVTVAILHDRVAGQVLPVTGGLFVGDPPELMYGYWGLREIAQYQFYTRLKGNGFWNKLKVRKDDNSSSSHRAVDQLVEYAVLDWLAMRAPAFNLNDSTEITLIQGGGGGSTSFAQKGVRVPASQPDEGNPLLTVRAIEIGLPERSKIVRKDKDPGFDISIETRHSRVRFVLTNTASNSFERSYETVGETLRRRSNLADATPNLSIVGLSVSLVTSQIAFSRFSDQAKLEAIWLDRLHASFDKDFSWDRLRHYYAGISRAPG